MAINKKLIHFKTKANFVELYEAGNILNTSIVFIQDAKEIWTHGTYYSCPVSKEELTNLLNSIIELVETEANERKEVIEELTNLISELSSSFKEYIEELYRIVSPNEKILGLLDWYEIDFHSDQNGYITGGTATIKPITLYELNISDYRYLCALLSGFVCSGSTYDINNPDQEYINISIVGDLPEYAMTEGHTITISSSNGNKLKYNSNGIVEHTGNITITEPIVCFVLRYAENA